MSSTSPPARCVVQGVPGPHRHSLSDAVVIVVIAVLACGLSVSGLAPASILAVLGGAGLVAAVTVRVLRCGTPGPGRTIMRMAHAISAP
ncbi:hypothetical protein GCM10010232_44530 [Streptomyces amakusaensis]|uniref:Uncharacterized protein n=1 Tax=Streptomyces amakusaensis TaxID=67271 RepID=A0ABW0ALD0_9ACTN